MNNLEASIVIDDYIKSQIVIANIIQYIIVNIMFKIIIKLFMCSK